MKTKSSYLVLITAGLIGGMIPGFISDHIKSASADNPSGEGNVIRARSFEMTDENGKVRAKMYMDRNNSVFELIDPHGGKTVCMAAGERHGVLVVGTPHSPELLRLNSTAETTGLDIVQKSTEDDERMIPRLSLGVGGPKRTAGLLLYGIAGKKLFNQAVFATAPQCFTTLQIQDDRGDVLWKAKDSN
jgi:hypothetical protein